MRLHAVLCLTCLALGFAALGCGSGRANRGRAPQPAQPAAPAQSSVPPLSARLAVTDIEVYPYQPIPHRVMNVRADVRNLGTAPSGPFHARVYLTRGGDEQPVCEIGEGHDQPSLAPGETRRIVDSDGCSVMDSGDYLVHVRLQPDGGLAATDSVQFATGPLGAVPPPPNGGSAILVVETNPSGASVRVGLRNVNNVLDTSSGRYAGSTPCMVQLNVLDVAPEGGINVLIHKDGYMDEVSVLSDGGMKLYKHGSYRLRDTPFLLQKLP